MNAILCVLFAVVAVASTHPLDGDQQTKMDQQMKMDEPMNMDEQTKMEEQMKADDQMKMKMDDQMTETGKTKVLMTVLPSIVARNSNDEETMAMAASEMHECCQEKSIGEEVHDHNVDNKSSEEESDTRITRDHPLEHEHYMEKENDDKIEADPTPVPPRAGSWDVFTTEKSSE